MALNKNAKKWVKALRSGKFKQAKGYLATMGTAKTTPGAFCCLGVACELAIQDGVRLSKRVYSSGNCFAYGGYNTWVLPKKVRKWLGLTSSEGDFRKNGHETSLVIKNDRGQRFAKIADIIESEPKGLFVE